MKIKLLLISSLALSGCALYGIEKIGIPYDSIQGVSKISNANSVAVSVQVHDIRADRTKIGDQKIGVFVKTPIPILAEIPIENTFRRAIETELANRGFHVSEKAEVQVNVDINRFYNDYNNMSGLAVAELQMLVTAKNNSGAQIYSKQVVAQGFDQVLRLTAENAIPPLSKALRNGIEILFGDNAFVPALLSTAK